MANNDEKLAAVTVSKEEMEMANKVFSFLTRPENGSLQNEASELLMYLNVCRAFQLAATSIQDLLRGGKEDIRIKGFAKLLRLMQAERSKLRKAVRPYLKHVSS